MINYPNKKKVTKAVVGVSNRGMKLEDMINMTNQAYLEDDIAIIHKKPIPIQIVKVDYPNREHAKISEAYYKIPSTTDYNGIYKGRYIDFEAKETRNKTSFPFSNIHPHQITHLESVIRHGGIGFVIIYLVLYDEIYFLDASYIIDAYRKSDIDRKSMPLDDIRKNGHLIKENYRFRINYLKIIDEFYLK